MLRPMVDDLRLGPHLPLTAIRVFEAAARRRNFKAAADELRLTPSAVSHQVRLLETLLKRPLFDRGRRGVELTPIGADLAVSAIEAFDILRRAAARAATDPSVLRISAAPVFARLFLVPRIEHFESARRDIDLRLEISLALADVVRGEADVGVRFGSGTWAGLFSERLLRIELVPVCAPAVLPGPSDPPTIAGKTLISITAARDGWARWCSAAGVERMRARRELWCDSLASALDAARDGVGIVLAPKVFVESELRAGRLVAASTVLSGTDAAYFMVCRRGEEETGRMRAARLWLASATSDGVRAQAAPQG